MIRLFIIAIALMFPLPAHADWIMLENGDRLSGSIRAETAESVSIQTDTIGTLTVPKASIASIHRGAAPRVLARELRTGRPLSTETLSTTQATVQASPVTTATTPAAPVRVDANKAEPKAGVYKWTGRISAGGTIQDGNSSSKTLTADADVKARDKNNRFGLGGEANWAEDEGRKTDNDQQIYANYDRFLSDKLFVGIRQSLEKDEFEELDLRSQSGLFAGYQFYEQDDLNLQIKAGPDYIYEDFENGDTESDIALSWALDYDQKFNEDAFQVFHKHEISTPFADTGAFLLESETGARVPISKRLDASAQVDFDWDNDPTDGIREDDTTYALKLGYGW